VGVQSVRVTEDVDIHQLTARIVAAYVSANKVPASLLSGIIRDVIGALATIDAEPVAAVAEPLKPAVPVRKSVTPDYIVCLEDGKKLKMLRRHLRTAYNLSPEAYRAKWGLAPDYPMVAPNYAARRSEFAKQIGLGRKAAPEEVPVPETKRKRARA